jgi:hypothetical protein
MHVSIKKYSARDIPPWEQLFDKPLPSEPSGWSSRPINKTDKRTVKKKRIRKARNRARGFLGAHGCQTGRIRGVRQLNYLLSICFRVSIDWDAKPKAELIRATRAIGNMGRTARRRKMRAAQKSRNPVIKAFWDPDRLVK